MSLRYLYVNSDAVGDSTDITANCRLYKADLTANAEEGSVATSTLVVDDPDGTLNIVGFKNVYITETVATGSNTVIGSFYVADRTISRGPYKTGAGRIWTVNLVDVNTIADWRVHVGSGNSRPAETDVARMNWLMGTSELAQVSNTTLLNTSGPVAMDAVDYNGQKSAQVMDDAAQQSGKNYFTYYREASSSPALFYDFSSSTAYTSSVRLSNVASDISGDANGLTFAISEDTKLVRSPSRVFSGAYVNYDGGAVYEQLASTYNTFRRRDAVVPADNVKTSAKATARANRYLTEMSTEEDVITTSFRVPAAKARFLREGMRCQIKASHLPGYTTFTWGRVLMWNMKQDSEEEYLITVDLSVEPGVVTQPAGAASLYGNGDNGVVWYINGVEVSNNGAGDNNTLRPITAGTIVSGDNVLAVLIENGVEPASWALGNPTYLESTLYPSGGATSYVFTNTSAKTWDVSNTPSGVIGGTPANWNLASFDDTAWANAIDVTSTTELSSINERSPARLVAPSGAPIGTYARGLVWLCRMNFTAS